MRIRYEKPALGVGGFGRVYKARASSGKGSRVVALKKVRCSDYVEFPGLLHEVCGLVLVKGHPNIPQAFGWGKSQFYEYLALQLLDCDLYTRFKEEPFTRRNFVSLVLQMFAAVKHVHANGILHCDIKPENFMFGLGENAGRIYLIDFNLWTAWRSFETDEHLTNGQPGSAAVGFRGTFRYASINCHLNRALSRRDDLESLAYAIFSLYADGLPWSRLGSSRRKEILKLKQVWREERSLQGSCEYPLGDLVYYAQGLDFESEPEYDVWRERFWRVDNQTSNLPESDPLYDPADTTENLPRNMDFISWSFCQGKTFDVEVPMRTNKGRMERAPYSDHEYLPASSGWGFPLTMLARDTLPGEQDIIRGVVEHISQPPTTTYSSLDPSCPPEEMRDFDAPIPFAEYWDEEGRGEGYGVDEGTDEEQLPVGEETVEETETETDTSADEERGGRRRKRRT